MFSSGKQQARNVDAASRLLVSAAFIWEGIAASEQTWYCSNSMPWEECRTYLPSEKLALDRFLRELAGTSLPRAGTFSGRGIVMSGGQAHVLQALANLEVIRKVHGSDLPVEFWHAFELHSPHCELLERMNAKCRQLQLPGVYPKWETVLPSILSSSFKEVLWMDTDITLLVKPDLLFQTRAFRSKGAVFWPDLWGMGCHDWGQTSWPHHIAWHLLDLEHNASDPHCSQEHEPGLHLVDKERHWQPLCLANYLASRDFFTRVLYGYKDVFRLSWLKLGANNFLNTVRPGLIGTPLPNGQFFPFCLIHFWRAGGAFGTGEFGRDVPLYIHQKKIPGNLWREIVTFRQPLGACVKYRLQPFVPDEFDADIWHISYWHPELLSRISTADQSWNEGYERGKLYLSNDPRLSSTEVDRLHPKRDTRKTKYWRQMVQACRCDYSDNRWFQLITALVIKHLEAPKLLDCQAMLRPTVTFEACEVGYTVRALLCSQASVKQGDIPGYTAALNLLHSLLPKIEGCLPKSFWPVQIKDLKDFVRGVETKQKDVNWQPEVWLGDFQLPKERLAKFPRHLRRCVPLPDTSCWDYPPDGLEDLGPHTNCLYCCDPNFRNQPWRAQCFTEVYTESRCCNMDEE